MYQIYADDELIYDSGSSEYKIGKGAGSLEVNKSGSFTFSVYSDHFYYDRFVKLKTVVVVKKSGRILFRGRVFDEQVGYWKEKILTCEGEMGFFQDSIIRPYDFSGTPSFLLKKFLDEHNAQVDEFKKFKPGRVTVVDQNNYIARSNSAYETTLSNMNSRLIEDSTGGYLHITHGDDDTDPVPTLNYLADFERVSTQTIEFGKNLRDFVKKSSGQEIATAIIPLGAKTGDDSRLTIASVNNGVDYVYDEAAVQARGWVFKTVEWDDVTLPENLKAKALAYLEDCVKEPVTLELNAIDLSLLDRSIDSFRLGDYVRVVSPPHGFYDTLLCTRMTFDVLKPQNDTVVLGGVYSGFTAMSAKAASEVAMVKTSIKNIGTSGGGGPSLGGSLDSLIARSFGVFKTEQVAENGSTVYYLHDKMTLGESVNIWRMSAGVFSVSSDGGQTWSAGIDANGNAVLNMLSVIGIDAKWLRVGNLTDLAAGLGGWTIDSEGLHGRNEKYYIDLYCPTNNDWSDECVVIEFGRLSGSSKTYVVKITGGGKVWTTYPYSGIETLLYRNGIVIYQDGVEIAKITATANAAFDWKSHLSVDRIDFKYVNTEKRDYTADNATLSLMTSDGGTKTLTIKQGIIMGIK